jgi:hypothetical protein
MFGNLGLDARNRVRTARRYGMMPGASLRLRRTWYAEEGQNPDGAASNSGQGEGQEAAGGEVMEVGALPKWAQDLIKGLRVEAGDHRLKAKQAADAKTAAEAAALAERGQYKELYEKTQAELDALKPTQERAALLEAKIQATNEARIKRIPDQFKPAVPLDYSPDRLSEWLDANEQLFTKTPAPNLNGGAGGSGGSGSTQQPKVTAEHSTLAAIAQQAGYNIKPEQVAARAKEIEAQREQQRRNPKKEE